MKNIELVSLKLENFKGIESLEIDFANKTDIFGDNKTGKTTIADAIFWLLFDKNSANETKFEIKTLDINNNVIHNLDHCVSGVISVNNKKINLKKVYKGVYDKENNFANKNTTDYYINEIKVAKKEYDQNISEIVNEDLFKLLTNPLHFSNNLKVEERRNIILSLVEQPSDKEVLSQGDFTRLAQELEERSLEDIKKLATQKSKEAKKQADTLPDIIKSLENNARQYKSDKTSEELEKEINVLRQKENELRQQIASSNNSEELDNLENNLRQLNSEKFKITTDLANNFENEMYLINQKKQKINSEIQELKDKQISLAKQKELANLTIERLEKQLVDFRNDYKNLSQKQFISSECSFCGQALPVEKTEELKEQFNLNKSNELKELSKVGTKLKEEQNNLLKEVEELGIESVKCDMRIEELEEEMLLVNREEKELEKTRTQTKPELEKISLEIQELEKKLNNFDKTDTSNLENQLNDVVNTINILQEEKMSIKLYENMQTYILKHKETLKETNKEYLANEILKNECVEFERLKLNMLTDEINSKFDIVKFRLFTEDLSGRINDDCTAVVAGVPFGSSLNNAGRIQAGIDIIKALQKHYQINAPIIVDNAESITTLPALESQLIRLVVSSADKKLRIEKGE